MFGSSHGEKISSEYSLNSPVGGDYEAQGVNAVSRFQGATGDLLVYEITQNDEEDEMMEQ